MASGNPIIVEKDIYDLLDSQDYFDGWTSFWGFMPDNAGGSHDECVAVNCWGGLSTEHNSMQRPNFQVLVRSATYSAGRTKIQEILDYLMQFDECSQREFTINGHHYVVLIALGTAPNDLGKDEKKRQLFSINFNGIVEHSDNVVGDTLGSIVFDTLGDVIYDTLGGAVDG